MKTNILIEKLDKPQIKTYQIMTENFLKQTNIDYSVYINKDYNG